MSSASVPATPALSLPARAGRLLGFVWHRLLDLCQPSTYSNLQIHRIELVTRRALLAVLPRAVIAALLMFAVGEWLVGASALKYGFVDAAPELSYQFVFLAAGQFLALLFVVSNCGPSSFIDCTMKRRSGETRTLEYLGITPERYLSVPWLIAGPVMGVAVLYGYWIVFLLLEALLTPMAELLNLHYLKITVVSLVDWADLAHITVVLALQSLVVVMTPLYFALCVDDGVHQSPLSLLQAINTVKLVNTAISAIFVLQVISFALS